MLIFPCNQVEFVSLPLHIYMCVCVCTYACIYVPKQKYMCTYVICCSQEKMQGYSTFFVRRADFKSCQELLDRIGEAQVQCMCVYVCVHAFFYVCNTYLYTYVYTHIYFKSCLELTDRIGEAQVWCVCSCTCRCLR